MSGHIRRGNYIRRETTREEILQFEDELPRKPLKGKRLCALGFTILIGIGTSLVATAIYELLR